MVIGSCSRFPESYCGYLKRVRQLTIPISMVRQVYTGSGPGRHQDISPSLPNTSLQWFSKWVLNQLHQCLLELVLKSILGHNLDWLNGHYGRSQPSGFNKSSRRGS